jgi:hypothetical protein
MRNAMVHFALVYASLMVLYYSVDKIIEMSYMIN